MVLGCGETSFPSKRGQLGEELVLAEVATVGGIGEIVGVRELLSPQHPNGDPELLGDLKRLCQLPAGQARRVGNCGQTPLTQNLTSHMCEKDRIYPSFS